jgi:PII-like signaling protein
MAEKGSGMKLEGPQKRLTIFIGESDRFGHTPLATEIVQRAHAAGLAGVSVFRGVEGYGASNHIHTTRILSLSDDLPMAVIIVDSSAAIEAFLPALDELITEGLVIIDDVDVVKYVGRVGKKTGP